MSSTLCDEAIPALGRTTVSSTMIAALATLVLALVPMMWVVRHRGTRRRIEEEGRLDGFLLLVALLCSLGTLLFAGVTIVRTQREAREWRESRNAIARVDACDVSTRRTAGRGGGRSHELRCDVRYAVDGRPYATTVRAGYPGRRGGYDAWMLAHPPGSEITLRYLVHDPSSLVGFSRLVPATTTAASAARTALTLGALSLVLFSLSRAVVRSRRSRRSTRVPA